MMTWDDGIASTIEISGGYPLKLTSWRAEGGGDVAVPSPGCFTLRREIVPVG